MPPVTTTEPPVSADDRPLAGVALPVEELRYLSTADIRHKQSELVNKEKEIVDQYNQIVQQMDDLKKKMEQLQLQGVAIRARRDQLTELMQQAESLTIVLSKNALP